MADAIERVSLTIPSTLVDDLDEAVKEWGYSSRSEAFRDALRMFLTDLDWQNDHDTTHRGSITIIYRHSDHNINDEILKLQHEMSEFIIATQHVHFDIHLCLETIVVNGPGDDIRNLANSLRSLDGVQHVEFTNI